MNLLVKRLLCVPALWSVLVVGSTAFGADKLDCSGQAAQAVMLDLEKRVSVDTDLVTHRGVDGSVGEIVDLNDVVPDFELSQVERSESKTTYFFTSSEWMEVYRVETGLSCEVLAFRLIK